MNTVIKMCCIFSLITLFNVIPVQADDTDECAHDYDVSRITGIPFDENAKYAFNEVEIIVNASIEDVFHFAVYEPLEILVPGTDAVPGVRSTRSLNHITACQDGYLRVVCLDDGNTVLEKVIKNIPHEYYLYQVWNYSFKYGDNIEYAKGEFRFTPEGDKTLIRWRYSFKLNQNKLLGRTGPLGRWLFKKFFLRTRYNDFMNASLDAIKRGAEKKTGT